MADLVFYTNPQSRGQTVRWMLEEIGQPYETEILDYASTMKQEPYLSINPMGKVPAIKHKGKVVTEVAAIICYLAEAFPEAGLAPRDDRSFPRRAIRVRAFLARGGRFAAQVQARRIREGANGHSEHRGRPGDPARCAGRA